MFYFVTKTTNAPTFIGSSIITFRPGEVHDRRYFPIFNLIVVHQGYMALVENGVEYIINAGEYFIQEPFKLHYGIKPNAKTTTFSFVCFSLPDGYELIDVEHLDSLYSTLENGRFLRPNKYRFCIPKYGTCSNSLLKTSWELGLGEQHGYSPFKSKALFYQLFDELLENTRLMDTENINTRDIKAFINRYYTDKDFSLDWLCEKFCYTRQYITKALKAQTGMNFREYISHLRIEYAKNLLATRSTTVSSIASMLGYADTAAFCHHFSKKTGITPSEYQKRHLIKK